MFCEQNGKCIFLGMFLMIALETAAPAAPKTKKTTNGDGVDQAVATTAPVPSGPAGASDTRSSGDSRGPSSPDLPPGLRNGDSFQAPPVPMYDPAADRKGIEINRQRGTGHISDGAVVTDSAEDYDDDAPSYSSGASETAAYEEPALYRSGDISFKLQPGGIIRWEVENVEDSTVAAAMVSVFLQNNPAIYRDLTALSEASQREPASKPVKPLLTAASTGEKPLQTVKSGSANAETWTIVNGKPQPVFDAPPQGSSKETSAESKKTSKDAQAAKPYNSPLKVENNFTNKIQIISGNPKKTRAAAALAIPGTTDEPPKLEGDPKTFPEKGDADINLAKDDGVRAHPTTLAGLGEFAAALQGVPQFLWVLFGGLLAVLSVALLRGLELIRRAYESKGASSGRQYYITPRKAPKAENENRIYKPRPWEKRDKK